MTTDDRRSLAGLGAELSGVVQHSVRHAAAIRQAADDLRYCLDRSEQGGAVMALRDGVWIDADHAKSSIEQHADALAAELAAERERTARLRDAFLRAERRVELWEANQDQSVEIWMQRWGLHPGDYDDN